VGGSLHPTTTTAAAKVVVQVNYPDGALNLPTASSSKGICIFSLEAVGATSLGNFSP
jgi:hypothetical protein